MRLIDADALKKHLLSYAGMFTDELGFAVSLQAVSNGVDSQPTIEAESVKHGKWVDHMVRDWRCSECGEKINKVRNVDGYCYDDKPNYCPNCGAKMDGGADHED